MAERSTESTAKLTEAKAKAEARDKCKKFSSASPGIDWIGIPMKGLRFFRRRWTRQTDPRGTQPASQPARQPDSQTVRRTDRTRSLGQSSQWTQSAQRSSSPWYTLIAPPTALSPGSGSTQCTWGLQCFTNISGSVHAIQLRSDMHTKSMNHKKIHRQIRRQIDR